MSLARTPRIVHVVPALFGDNGLIGGGERYPVELVRAMARRANVRLVSFGREPRVETLPGTDVEVRVLRNWLPFPRFSVDPVNPMLLAHLAGADIIHYHQTHTFTSSVALLYARARGTPIFTTNYGGGGLALHHLVDVSPWYAGHLHISEFSRRAFGHEGATNARVILGGVDAERFRPAPASGSTGDVLFVGRLLPHKGINYLIEAVDADTPLTIVGRRWWRRHDRFYALLHDLAAGKRVEFREAVGEDDLVTMYQRALCVVLPSVYTTVFGERYTVPELLGQTLLEGMACGIPAICTAVGGMPEIVEDAVNGFVVPPNDPASLADRITWLHTHPAERQRMGEAARQRVLERFSWDGVVERCLAAYGAA